MGRTNSKYFSLVGEYTVFMTLNMKNSSLLSHITPWLRAMFDNVLNRFFACLCCYFIIRMVTFLCVFYPNRDVIFIKRNHDIASEKRIEMKSQYLCSNVQLNLFFIYFSKIIFIYISVTGRFLIHSLIDWML